MKFIVLLIVGLGAAFGLYRCLPSAKAPEPAVVVAQAHEAFPAAPVIIPTPRQAVKTKTPKRAKVLPRSPATKKHVERYVSPPAPAYVPEELPAPLPCLFSWIAPCTPGGQ